MKEIICDKMKTAVLSEWTVAEPLLACLLCYSCLLFQKFDRMEVAGTLPKYDMETDISQMEAPTFTTIDRSNPAPMLALDWDHKVNLVGKKVMNPMIHCCDKCLKPILIYISLFSLLGVLHQLPSSLLHAPQLLLSSRITRRGAREPPDARIC